MGQQGGRAQEYTRKSDLQAGGTHPILMLDKAKMSEYSTFICTAMTL
jgi:hypothetical protein